MTVIALSSFSLEPGLVCHTILSFRCFTLDSSLLLQFTLPLLQSWLSATDALSTPIPCDSTPLSALTRDLSALNLSNSIHGTFLLRLRPSHSIFPLLSPGMTVSQRRDLYNPNPQNLTPRRKSSETVCEHTRAVLFKPQLLLFDKLLSTSKVKICFKRTKGMKQGNLPHLEKSHFYWSVSASFCSVDHWRILDSN